MQHRYYLSLGKLFHTLLIMMKLTINPDRESLTGVQEVEGAAVSYRARLVQREEVGVEGVGVLSST